jgi:hypothetical protein
MCEPSKCCKAKGFFPQSIVEFSSHVYIFGCATNNVITKKFPCKNLFI